MAKRRTFLAAMALAFVLVAVGACSPASNRPDVTVNGGCIGCLVNANAANANAANANAAALKQKQAVDPDNLVVSVSSATTIPVTYLWHNRSYQGADAFLQVVQAEVAAWLEKVKPSDSPPYGSLRVVFPVRSPPVFDKQQNPAGAAEGENTWKQFWRLIDDGRLKAIEKSKLFTSVASETANVSILDPGQTDFALWFDSGYWHLRYHKGNTQSVGNAINIGLWVGGLNVIAKSAKSNENAIFTMNWQAQTQKVWFTVLGTDYFTVEPMIPVLNAEFERQGRQARPITDRIGGRIKVVLSTFSQGNTTFNVGTPQNIEFVRRANQEFALAAARGKVEALRSSNLFDSVTVETADVSDVPLDDYDVVLWQPAIHPWTWHFRIAGTGDAFALVLPPKSEVAQFADIVYDNIRKAKPGS